MLNAGDTSLRYAIEQPTREALHKLEVDWLRNGAYAHAYSDLSDVVTDVSLSSDYVGSLPEEATLVEGYAAATLTITLAGKFYDGRDVVDLFTPYRTDSPFYGVVLIAASVRWDLKVRKADGTAPSNLQFTGQITDVSIDHDTRRVTMTAVDNAEKVRSSISLPVWLNREFTGAADPDFDQSIGIKINSQWLIDHIARNNGLYQSPTPPSGVEVLADITGHGGLICSKSNRQYSYAFGYANGNYTFPPPYSPNIGNNEAEYFTLSRFGKALAAQPGSFAAAYAAGSPMANYKVANGLVLSCQFQAKFGTSNTFMGANVAKLNIVDYTSAPGFGNTIRFGISSAGKPFIEVFDDLNVSLRYVEFAAVTSNTWHDVAFGIYINGASSEFKCRVDGGSTTTTVASISGLSTADTSLYPAGWNVWTHLPISNIVITRPTSSATIPNSWYSVSSFVPNASIDAGLNYLTGLPWREEVDSWELLKEVVGAEFGTHRFKADGSYQFLNRNNAITERLTADKTVDPSEDIQELAFQYRSESVRNSISVQTAPIVWDSNPSWVYEHSNAASILAYPGTTYFYILLPEPMLPDEFFFYNLDSATYRDLNWISNKVVAANNSTNAELANGTIEIKAEVIDRQHRLLKLTIFNTSGVVAKFTDDQNNPALLISGYRMKTMPATTTVSSNATSVAAFGRRDLALGQGDFFQVRSVYEDLLRALVDDLKTPLPIIENLNLSAGDPRVELADVVSLIDQRVGGEMLAMISGIDRSFSVSEGIKDTYRVQVFGQPGRWILGHTVYGVLASTTIPG